MIFNWVAKYRRHFDVLIDCSLILIVRLFSALGLSWPFIHMPMDRWLLYINNYL